LAIAVVASAHAWRRGADALALAPISAGCALGTLIAYGILAPAENTQHSHRELAQTLRRLIPQDVRSLPFFNEIDEGLWFYKYGLDLVPVPGSQPHYNAAYALLDAYRTRRFSAQTIEDLDALRRLHDRQVLMQWLDHNDSGIPYLLIRSNLY